MKAARAQSEIVKRLEVPNSRRYTRVNILDSAFSLKIGFFGSKILIKRKPSRKHIRRRAEPLNKAAPTLYRTSIVMTHCSVVSLSWLKDSYWPDQLQKCFDGQKSREKDTWRCD